jgi:hypothetical protein
MLPFDEAGVDGAGHLAPLETPESFRELVLAFLREQPAIMGRA